MAGGRRRPDVLRGASELAPEAFALKPSIRWHTTTRVGRVVGLKAIAIDLGPRCATIFTVMESLLEVKL